MSLCQRIGRVNSRRSSSGFNFLRINGRVTGSCETNEEKGQPQGIEPEKVQTGSLFLLQPNCISGFVFDAESRKPVLWGSVDDGFAKGISPFWCGYC
jgi:hypothetical protein